MNFVFSSKRLIDEKPLIHETCWTHTSIKRTGLLAALTELPKSSCEWEISGGRLRCSTNVSSNENKCNLERFYCRAGRATVICIFALIYVS